jgi:hypothetical protein
LNLLQKIYTNVGYKLLSIQNINTIVLAIKILQSNNYIDKHFIKTDEIKRLLVDFEKVILSTTGVLVIVYKDKVIKFPLGEKSKKSLTLEYKNYLIIKSISPKIVNYILEEKESYFFMDKLYPIENKSSALKEVSSQLETLQKKQPVSTKYLKKSEFNNVFKILKKKCSQEVGQKILNFLNASKLIHSMPMHGDLTQFNIMKNKKNQTVVIDLDRFRMDGYQDLDRTHFIIEYYAKRDKVNFFNIINKTLQAKKISLHSYTKLLLYFIYRIEAEYNKDIILPKIYYENICKNMQLFLDSDFFIYNEVDVK